MARLLQRHPEQARQTVLKPILGTERFVMTPRVTSDGRFYDFKALPTYDRLVAGVIGAGNGRVMTVVPPG